MRDNMGVFRGKCEQGGEWISGWYLETGYSLIWQKEDSGTNPYVVIPGTVGECTGLRDKNGDLIYEGDIISIDGAKGDELVYVKYQINGFECVSPIWKYYRHRLEDNPEKYVIIGNIHDNPELIRGDGK